MASLASLQFLLELKAESSLLLYCTNRRQPRLGSFSNRPRKSLVLPHLRGLACGCSGLRAVEDGLLNCSFCYGRMLGLYDRGQFLSVRAAGRGSAEGDDGENVEIEDKLQATIEKSKRILEMQRDLLNQIAERRKLVSTIQNSMISATEAETAYEDGMGISSHEDVASTSDNSTTFEDNVLGETNGQSFSGSPPHSTMEIPERVLTKEPDKAERNLKRQFSSEVTPSSGDSSEQLNSISSDSVQSREVPSFLLSTLEVESLEMDQDESLKESSLQNVDNETADPVSEDMEPPPLAGPNVMNVILVAAECAPWSKTGGLGDVAGSLPKALARRGHRVMVVAPRYGNYAEAQQIGERTRYKVDGQDHEVTYFQAYVDGVDFVFIDSPMFRHIENNIYGGKREDILKRMVLFCKAAVEVPWHVPCGGICYGDGNLVFITNDWHTALLPVYLKAYYRDNGLMSFTRSILVIHNIAHQGRGPVDDFSYVDLPPHYIDLFKMYDPIGGDHFNIFAAGLKAADRVITVSHGYAWELKTSDGGWGLHNIINEMDWKLRGIVNGIDTKEWSPQYDVHLTSDGYTNYSLENLQTGKALCKEALQKELGLPLCPHVPLLGFIGRLDRQKGVDLIAEAVPWLMDQDVQLVMLGTGRQDLEQMLRQFEGQHRDRIRGWVGFSVKMAHRITAGSDILLMPSRFEPCGLNQLYAMSYGTIPVVHAVGGLRDTVQPFDPISNTGLGWTFDSAEANKLINALGYCLMTYRQYKESWEGIQRRGMTQDLSWDNAARNYEEVLVAAKYQW